MLLSSLVGAFAVYSAFAAPPPSPATTQFHSTHGSYMLLQRAPAKAAVYGTVGAGEKSVSKLRTEVLRSPDSLRRHAWIPRRHCSFHRRQSFRFEGQIHCPSANYEGSSRPAGSLQGFPQAYRSWRRLYDYGIVYWLHQRFDCTLVQRHLRRPLLLVSGLLRSMRT